MMRHKPEISIINVVATFKLDKRLNLEKIHKKFRDDSLWDEKIFRKKVVVLKRKKPKMSFLIYETGSVVCCGARSIEDAEQSSVFFIKNLNKKGVNVTLSKPVEIQNIVATCHLQRNIDLNLLTKTFSDIEYEPEQYSAAIYRAYNAPDVKATILVSNSGHLYCAGLKRYKDVKAALRKLVLELEHTKII